MESINSLSALSQLLRRKVSETDAGLSRPASSSGDATETAPTATALRGLELQVRMKLNELGPGAGKSTGFRRWMIALVLGCEHGPRLQTEPRFIAMVQSVLQAVERDARLKAKFDSVVAELSGN